MIQTKANDAVCSCVGDTDKHEKFKKLSMERRIEQLQEVYDKYGPKSEEFFKQVKPFIMWGCYRHLRGIPTIYLEDLVNCCYEELIIAFLGGETEHYNKIIYKQPKYQTQEYYKKYNNIGKFVLDTVASAVSKFKNKMFRKSNLHEDRTIDLYDKETYTDFEVNNTVGYELDYDYGNETNFSNFKFNKEFLEHLELLKQLKPTNNVLYNFILWRQV